MRAAHETQRCPAFANDLAHDEEITIERRVKAAAVADVNRKTTRIAKIDAQLLAMARGEIEPDDPFGGLIPIYDDDDGDAALEIDQAWLMLEPEPLSEPGHFGLTVPSIRMCLNQLLALPLEPRASFFLAQIDGRRTVDELVSVCALDDLSGLEIVDELLRFGAITLR